MLNYLYNSKKALFYLNKIVLLALTVTLAICISGSSQGITPQYVFSQEDNSDYDTWTSFDHFILDIPSDWTNISYDDGSEMFCNTFDCNNASEMVRIIAYTPSPDKAVNEVFEEAIQQDENDGFVTTGQPTIDSQVQSIAYTYHDPTSGLDYDVLAFHQIADGEVYKAYFMWLPEEYESFLPIMKRISSTWHTDESGSGSTQAFDIESQIIHNNGCANRYLAGNIDVNPTYQHYDSDCQMWMNGP